jgi:outer membrane protein OmpA-like peptidoglycan-associated protein/tetratricopeptide (TPR) repeat protein
MKQSIIVLALVCSLWSNAQNKATAAADKLFARLEYVEAAQAYQKLVDNGKGDNYIYRQLAEANYNVFNSTEAVKWFALAAKESQDAEFYWKYAQMLKANGKYEEANKQMAVFAQKAPNDKRAVNFKSNPNYLSKLLDKQKAFNVKTLKINSEKTDFGGFLDNESQLYFVSSRNKTKRTDGWNEEPYLDIYRVTYTLDGNFGKVEEQADLNTKWHDGPVCIAPDGKTMYFARDSHAEKKFEKDKKLNAKFGQVNLYRATKNGEKWENITPLPFNSNTYSTSAPSLSADGKTLYFSSDMPGSLGASDIWKVSINGDTYGTPENLGPNVNTEANEQFPFITADNVLYFASNGRTGLGGLDIFVANLSKNEPASNLGKPVNSEKDDFAFSFNTGKNVGFISSNRSGNDDIYLIEPLCAVEAEIVVTNSKTGAPLANAQVTILDEKKNAIQMNTTDANGVVNYTVECDKAYGIQAAQQGFENGVFAINKSKNGKITIQAPLTPIEVMVTEKEVILNEISFEYNKSNITQEGAFELDKLVAVMNSNPNMEILVKAHTDNRGGDQFNMQLSDRRAKATVQYIISKGIAASRIQGKGFGESEPKIDCKENCTEEQHAINRRSEFLIVKK